MEVFFSNAGESTDSSASWWTSEAFVFIKPDAGDGTDRGDSSLTSEACFFVLFFVFQTRSMLWVQTIVLGKGLGHENGTTKAG